jgi:hypothetical protein
MNRERERRQTGRATEQVRQNERLLSELERQDLLALMATEWGRRLYYRLVFELCLLESGSFDTNGSTMAMIGGVRSVGTILKNEAIEHCPELWCQAVTERTMAAADRVRAERAALDEERKQQSNQQRISR